MASVNEVKVIGAVGEPFAMISRAAVDQHVVGGVLEHQRVAGRDRERGTRARRGRSAGIDVLADEQAVLEDVLAGDERNRHVHQQRIRGPDEARAIDAVGAVERALYRLVRVGRRVRRTGIGVAAPGIGRAVVDRVVHVGHVQVDAAAGAGREAGHGEARQGRANRLHRHILPLRGCALEGATIGPRCVSGVTRM